MAGDSDGADETPIADAQVPPINGAPRQEQWAGGAGQDAMPGLAADEGGMIVLTADPSSPASTSQTMLASSQEEPPHQEGGGLRSDKPMARFQAFDVADGLASHRQSEGPTLQEPQHQGEQAAAARHGPAGKTAQAAAAASTARGRTILRSVASLPFVMVAALLTGAGRRSAVAFGILPGMAEWNRPDKRGTLETDPSSRFGRSEMSESFDALSEVFRNARPHAWIAKPLTFAAPWSLRGGGARSAAFYCVLQGRCRLDVDAPKRGKTLGRAIWRSSCRESPIVCGTDGTTPRTTRPGFGTAAWRSTTGRSRSWACCPP